jgi:hypothetical protein
MVYRLLRWATLRAADVRAVRSVLAFEQSEVPAVAVWVPTPGDMASGFLDPATAVVTVQGILLKQIPEGALKGWLFSKKPKDRHGRSSQVEGSHVPYQCLHAKWTTRRARNRRAISLVAGSSFSHGFR